MKKLFTYILFVLIMANISFAEFDGYPWSTNNTWQQARTYNVISQLWEAVQERCYSLTNRTPILNIVEDWSVQIGYSNNIVERHYTTNTFYITNRIPYFVVVQTTNQVCDYTFTTNMSWASSWFETLNTNTPINNITSKISLPVTHNFISTLDQRMFDITPYFINTNFFNVDNNLNDWFGKTNEVVEDKGWGYWVSSQQIVDSPYSNGEFEYYVGIGYSYLNALPSFYEYRVGRPDWSTYRGSIPFGNDNINKYSKWVWVTHPEDYPYLCPASAMTNACVGYVTNIVKDTWGNITDGRYYFTRQPLTTNSWSLWQATRDKADVTISGMGYPYDGNYFLDWVTNIKDYYVEDQGKKMALNKWSIVGNTCYINEHGRATIICSDTVSNGFNHIYSDVPIIFQTQNGISEAALQPQYVSLTQYGANTIYDPSWSADVHDFISSLNITNASTTNGWRLLNTWWDGHVGDPPDADANYSSLYPSTNLIWKTRPLSYFDKRYYDESPRPFYHVTCPSNYTINITVSNAGTAFLDFNSPDYDGKQVTEPADETVGLSQVNTPSNFRWYDIIFSTVIGEAPQGTSVVLMWTNSHTYGELPYRLEIKDLDERCAYLKQLLYTTTPYWNWTNTVTSNVESNDSVADRYVNYDIEHNTKIGDWFLSEYWTGHNTPIYNWLTSRYGSDPIIETDTYEDYEEWKSDIPPSFGQQGPVGDWSYFLDWGFNVPSFYNDYANLQGGQASIISTDGVMPPSLSSTYSTGLDFSGRIEFYTPWNYDENGDPTGYGPDGGILVTNIYGGYTNFYLANPDFPSTWMVRGDGDFHYSHAPNQAYTGTQSWRSVTAEAKCYIYDNDIRVEKSIQLYTKSDTRFTNSATIAMNFDKDIKSTTIPPPKYESITKLGSSDTIYGGNFPLEQHLHTYAYTNGYQPTYYTNKISTNFNFSLTKTNPIVNNIKILYYSNWAPPPGEQIVYTSYAIYYTNGIEDLKRNMNVGTFGVAPYYGPYTWPEGIYHSCLYHPYSNQTVAVPNFTTNSMEYTGMITVSGYVSNAQFILPKAESPMVAGVEAWVEVITNIVIIYTNFVDTTSQGYDVWQDYANTYIDRPPDWPPPPILWKGGDLHNNSGIDDVLTYLYTTNDISITNLWPATLYQTNYLTICVRWDDPPTEELVAIRTGKGWEEHKWQLDAGAYNKSTQILDPLMYWNYKRK